MRGGCQFSCWIDHGYGHHVGQVSNHIRNGHRGFAQICSISPVRPRGHVWCVTQFCPVGLTNQNFTNRCWVIVQSEHYLTECIVTKRRLQNTRYFQLVTGWTPLHLTESFTWLFFQSFLRPGGYEEVSLMAGDDNFLIL